MTLPPALLERFVRQIFAAKAVPADVTASVAPSLGNFMNQTSSAKFVLVVVVVSPSQKVKFDLLARTDGRAQRQRKCEDLLAGFDRSVIERRPFFPSQCSSTNE